MIIATLTLDTSLNIQSAKQSAVMRLIMHELNFEINDKLVAEKELTME